MAVTLIDKKLTAEDVAQRLTAAYRDLNTHEFLRELVHAVPGRRGVR